MADAVTTVTAVPASTLPTNDAKTTRTMEAHVARLQAAFARALTEEDVVGIARTLIEQAREGDTTAARLVLKYGLGSVTSAALADGVLQAEAKKAAEPTQEQRMAAVWQRIADQDALAAEIRAQGRPGPAPRSADRRPDAGRSPGNAGR